MNTAQIINGLLSFCQNFGGSVVSCAKIVLLSRPTGCSLQKPGKPVAVILGNGPSLNQDLPDLLEFRSLTELVCVNMFSRSALYEQLKPENYLVLDDAFADENHEGATQAIHDLAEKTSWPVRLFVPIRFRKKEHFRKLTSGHPFVQVFFFNYTIFEGFEGLKFAFFNAGLAMPQCQNVLNAALFHCIRRGYDKVILLGADHTWHEDIRLNEDNELRVYDTHFYQDKAKDISAMFLKTRGSYLRQAFLNLHKVYRSYEIIAAYALSKGVEVINSSSKSYIDVFKKVKLKDEFKR